MKGRKGDGELSGDAKHSTMPSRNSTRDQPEPGLINPAYEESEDGMESFNHPKSCHCNCDFLQTDLFVLTTNTSHNGYLFLRTAFEITFKGMLVTECKNSNNVYRSS